MILSISGLLRLFLLLAITRMNLSFELDAPVSESGLVLVDSPYSRVNFTQVSKVFQPSKKRMLTFVRSPQLSFVNAVAACAFHGEIMAEFKDEDDIKFVNEAFKNGSIPSIKDVPYLNVGGMFVGPASSQYDQEGTKTAPKAYQWFESGLNITNWGPGQPNKLTEENGWDEDCVVLKSVDYTWRVEDHTCTPERPFVCSSPQ